ncbi:MAG: hypothetical protein Q9219_000044 [cf. Caloplaca sp. 3 TL-2023]
MAPQDSIPGHEEADFAKALQELARGEQTASAMETQLTALEKKIDDLLATAQSSNTIDGSDPGKEQTANDGRMADKK